MESKFVWKKKGLIFAPDGHREWMNSHVQCPYSFDFGSFLRVYFATREAYKDGISRAFIGFMDLDKSNLKQIINIAKHPVLELGERGEFDEFGNMPGSVIRQGDELWLYYIGWTRAVSTPYNLEIGLAKSKDGMVFKKAGRGPLLSATLQEPYLHSTPSVYKLSHNEWHMFYLSGIRWLEGVTRIESQYVLMHATSTDGLDWKRDGKPILPVVVENECQASASIIKLKNQWHMFFTYRYGLNFREERARGYKIGYAVSNDLIHWERDDSKVGVELSESGWDSEMMAYPHVTQIDDKIIMFYSGNGFGRTGYGYAELRISENK